MTEGTHTTDRRSRYDAIVVGGRVAGASTAMPLAVWCKCRYFCPSCHAKRLALWGLWLEQTLLADVPHRQVVLTVPKRLRPYFLYDRRLLGDRSRVAARTVTAFWRATVGEQDFAVGIVSSIQTHGSLAIWHPHLHLLVTAGGFRPDGTFVRLPLHDVATLTEAVRRTVLRMFVKRELRDGDTAQSVLAWPHAGFHVHDGVRAAADDMAFTVDPEPETLREARRRWAELLRRLFEVDPLACPRCGTEMRIVAFLTDPTTINRILDHLRRTHTSRRRPRAPPRRWTSPARTASA
jgi:hypothetical protein